MENIPTYTARPLVQHLALADFAVKVATAPVPVLLDFWAPWCEPCKQLGPVLESLAAEYGDRLQVFKIDVDKDEGARERFHVRGIPTILLMQGGQETARHVGVLSRLRLRTWIDSAVMS